MQKLLEKDFKNIVCKIKDDINNTRTRVIHNINVELIKLYYRIGKELYDNSKYGNNLITSISREIKIENPNISGFSVRNLKYMKRFYSEYRNEKQNVQQAVAQLPWGHNVLLFEKIKDINMRMIYISAAIENGWSRSVLEFQIETGYHKRIGNSHNNFKVSIKGNNSDLASSTLKDPYIFDFINIKNEYSEKELETALIDRIKNVLLELGKGFSFVGNQYKISTKDTDYYIDLLFYHLELRCYVVIELKNSNFKPEYIGQLSFYVTAINKTLRKDCDNETIGLLLCKEKDRLSVEWALEGVNNPIGVSSYKIDNYLTKDKLSKLPTEEELNMHIDIKK